MMGAFEGLAFLPVFLSFFGPAPSPHAAKKDKVDDDDDGSSQEGQQPLLPQQRRRYQGANYTSIN